MDTDTERSLTELTLRDGEELVGPYRGMKGDGDFLHVGVHDRMLVYHSDSEQARVLQDALREVPEGVRVGILNLILDGKPRLFVRIKEI